MSGSLRTADRSQDLPESMPRPRSCGWPSLLLCLYRLYFSTLHVRTLLPDGRVILPEQYPFENVIFAHCERDSLVLSGVLFRRRFSLLVAMGRDGDRAAAALQRTGSVVIRGSASRHGRSGEFSPDFCAAGLGRLIRFLRSSCWPAAVSVDGPLGPRGRAKGGALFCARHTGRPIVPLATAARRQLTFAGTWSGMFLPLPFSRVVIACGDPLRVPEEANRSIIRALSLDLTERLEQARTRAEAAVAAAHSPSVKSS